MVCEFGMSDLGPLTFGKKEEQIFLGREINQHRDYSEETAIRIDAEVKKFIDNGYSSARDILSNNRDVLTRIANALLEREVLDATEIKMLMDGKELPARPSSHDDGGVQQVLKPAPGAQQPGIVPGERPSPA
jgi:cell division protease FtsH